MKNRQNKKRRKGGMVREVMMSVIGTTISIILTFGTAHYVEEYNKRKDGRETAMMVIHDIDEYAEWFSNLAKEELRRYNLAVFVSERTASAEHIGTDTLEDVVNYITEEETDRYSIDDNIERTFQSTQDTWKNINMPAFIDEVRDFYNERREIIKVMNEGAMYEQPVEVGEVKSLAAKTWEKDLNAALREFLHQKLDDEQVKYYLARARNREKTFQQMSDKWKNKSERCKFMMGISDEDLKQYLEKRKLTGRNLKDKQLVGQWETVEDEPQQLEFRRDHTFSQVVTKRGASRYYSGKVIFRFCFTGTWEIQGDTLVRQYDRGRTVEVDDSEISILPEAKDSADKFVAELRDIYDNEQPRQKDWTSPDIRRSARIDKAARKIELRWWDSEDEEEKSSYYVRVK